MNLCQARIAATDPAQITHSMAATLTIVAPIIIVAVESKANAPRSATTIPNADNVAIAISA